LKFTCSSSSSVFYIFLHSVGVAHHHSVRHLCKLFPKFQNVSNLSNAGNIFVQGPICVPSFTSVAFSCISARLAEKIEYSVNQSTNQHSAYLMHHNLSRLLISDSQTWATQKLKIRQLSLQKLSYYFFTHPTQAPVLFLAWSR